MKQKIIALHSPPERSGSPKKRSKNETKRFWVVLFLLLGGFGGFFRSEVDDFYSKDLEKLQKDVQGVFKLKVILVRTGQTPLFCPPKGPRTTWTISCSVPKWLCSFVLLGLLLVCFRFWFAPPLTAFTAFTVHPLKNA